MHFNKFISPAFPDFTPSSSRPALFQYRRLPLASRSRYASDILSNKSRYNSSLRLRFSADFFSSLISRETPIEPRYIPSVVSSTDAERKVVKHAPFFL